MVYKELRKLATQRLAREAPGQALQSSDLVHEAYLRLVGEDAQRQWDSRALTSSPQPRRRCAASWSKRLAALGTDGTVVGGSFAQPPRWPTEI